jgi:hypothetical protein
MVTSQTAATMQLGSILPALAVALVVYQIFQTVLQWRRLSHVPGPFWAAFSKYWMVRESLKGRQPQAIKQMNDEYGEASRIDVGAHYRQHTKFLRK